jgi:serine/threonine-protein kinase
MSAPPPGGDAWIGRVVDGRYRILRRLGEGGMGLVFEAEHLRLGKKVALKIVLPDLLGDPEVAARFAREAIATAQIEHPHIASGFDYGMLPEGSAYLVAQLVRGTSLGELAKRGPMPWGEACRIGAQIADALAAIHRGGWVHRDLTPENVVIARRDDGSPHAYVLDFGVAAILGPAGERPMGTVTAIGTIVGTEGYMPPEQALGNKIDARADLYVLGVLLWEMLAGRTLFATGVPLTEVVSKQLNEPAPAPPRLPDAPLPPELAELLASLLAPEPAQRPANAPDVRAALLRIAEGAPALAAQDVRGPLRSAPELPATTSPRAATASARPHAASASARPRAAWALPALALAALAAVGAYASRGDSIPEAAQAPAEPTVESSIETLLHDDHRGERQSAAERILALPEARVPAFARPVAALELDTTCEGRRTQLARIREIGDPRALPAIERLRAAPREGCGRGRRTDCHACIRGELAATHDALVD